VPHCFSAAVADGPNHRNLEETCDVGLQSIKDDLQLRLGSLDCPIMFGDDLLKYGIRDSEKEQIFVVTKNNEGDHLYSSDFKITDASSLGDQIELRIITSDRAQKNPAMIVLVQCKITKHSTLAQLRRAIAGHLSISLSPLEEKAD
jgi:hypothetical protein